MTLEQGTNLRTGTNLRMNVQEWVASALWVHWTDGGGESSLHLELEPQRLYTICMHLYTVT